MEQRLVPAERPFRDPRRIQEVQTFLKKVWSVESLVPNPVPLPCSLSRENLEQLKENKSAYAVAEKSDGCRYSLVIGTYHDGVPYSLLVDRNLDMYEVKISAREDLYCGTVFEGELVWERYSRINPPRQEFLVFECVYFAGRDYGKKTYVDRLQIIHDVFYFDINDMNYNAEDWKVEAAHLAREGKVVCLGNVHNLKFTPKRCYLVTNIETLFKTLPTIRHRTDGLIFTPIYERVRRGRHRSMFKWKSEHTIDLLLEIKFSNLGVLPIEPYVIRDETLVPCENNLYSMTSGNPLKIEIEANDFVKSLVDHLKSREVEEYSIVAECSMEKLREDTWKCHPIILRRDKMIPNSSLTVELTLLHAEENITAQELYESLSSVS
jgi:hypothetical protein